MMLKTSQNTEMGQFSYIQMSQQLLQYWCYKNNNMQLQIIMPIIIQFQNQYKSQVQTQYYIKIMKQNSSLPDKKKNIIEIINQVGAQNEKPQRKVEIMNYLQLAAPGEEASSLALFKDRLAEWILNYYAELKSNINYFLQCGNLKCMSKEARDIIINIFKVCQQKIGDTIQPNDYFNNYFMKNPYLGYQHMACMYPPYMMPPAYSQDRQAYENYNMELHHYYMQMHKYPSYPVNQLFMPQMQMGMSKYPTPQSHELMKQYYPYSVGQPSVSNPPFTQVQPVVQKPKNASAPTSKQKVNEASTPVKNTKQTAMSRQVDQHDQILRKNREREKERHSKQQAKNLPFQIIPPYMCKVPRQEIPERVPNLNAQNPGMQIQQLTILDSQEVVIQQKPTELKMDKQKSNPKKKTGVIATNNPVNSPGFLGAGVTLAKNQSEEEKMRKNFMQANEPKNVLHLGQQYNQKFKQCTCKGYGINPLHFTCAECSKIYHYSCVFKKTNKMQGQQCKQLCHFCYLKNFDPLNKVIHQIKNIYLIDIRQKKACQFVNFELYSSYINKNSPFQIQIRSMRLEDASNSVPQYTWPDECQVFINQQRILELQALQHNSSVKKRKDVSFFLTNYIYNNKSHSQKNNISIGLQIKELTMLQMNQKKMRNNYIFIFCIYLVRKKTPEQLCDEIMKDPTNKVSFIEGIFSQPVLDEQQIAIQQIKIQLEDPFTWNLIEIPARGKLCNHGQCFDLKTFLGLMNVQKIKQWRCPVCNKQCRSFNIDVQQLQVIKQFKKQDAQGNNQRLSKQVSFHRDGRTLFVIQNQQQDDDKAQNSGEIPKTKIIAKDQKQSK